MEGVLIIHDFPWPPPKFHAFPGLESEMINSMTFQVFHDLYEPWVSNNLSINFKSYHLFWRFLLSHNSYKLEKHKDNHFRQDRSLFINLDLSLIVKVKRK